LQLSTELWPTAHGNSLLVSGYSGIGKSSVVHELHKALVPPRGLFASGKFDQYKRDIHTRTVGQAFQGLIRSLLTQSEEELGRWRDDLREALGSNGQLIVNVVPELELVIGKQPAVANLPASDAQNRFLMAFRRFLAVFARKEHPLALVLDDLQWLDAATLDLLEHLATQSEVRHLLLVGAYRDNEVSPSHPLLRTLGAIRKAGATLQEFILRRSPAKTWAISSRIRLAARRTMPPRWRNWCTRRRAAIRFSLFSSFPPLAEEGLLRFDHDALRWRWELDRLHPRDTPTMWWTS